MWKINKWLTSIFSFKYYGLILVEDLSTNSEYIISPSLPRISPSLWGRCEEYIFNPHWIGEKKSQWDGFGEMS